MMMDSNSRSTVTNLLRFLNVFWIATTLAALAANFFARREQLCEFVNEPLESLQTPAAAAAVTTAQTVIKHLDAQIRKRRGD